MEQDIKLWHAAARAFLAQCEGAALATESDIAQALSVLDWPHELDRDFLMGDDPRHVHRRGGGGGYFEGRCVIFTALPDRLLPLIRLLAEFFGAELSPWQDGFGHHVITRRLVEEDWDEDGCHGMPAPLSDYEVWERQQQAAAARS